MKRRLSSSTRRPQKKARSKTVSVPINETIAEILERMPEVFGRKRGKTAREAYLMLALHEGLMAMSDYFEHIQASRRVWRSDLVFRFNITPGVIGRAALAEQEARAIEAVLAAAVEAAED